MSRPARALSANERPASNQRAKRPSDFQRKLRGVSCRRANCHAGRQNIDRPHPGGFNEKAMAYHITNGKNSIPAFVEKLSETEVALVAAYVIKSAADGWE